ncbi:AmpG family muropeptide MFS transporter [Oleispirillum naphthae]|uniref:AmpG family muropeptide MFS transporter n=1 Tax=Oleispirillum naphthae TaxID=2838853 RepID=UPI0030826AFB
MPRFAAALAVYRDARLLPVLILGVASGLPSPLLFANLSIWLADTGLSRTAVAAFGAVATPYAINFLWAPLFDRMRPPLFASLGQRRGWLACLLCGLIAAVLLLGRQDPRGGLAAMAACAVAVAALSASLDVVVDAYRIETLDPPHMGAGSAATVAGWHIGGTVVGGAGGLVLAARFGWPAAYAALACALALPLFAVFFIREPAAPQTAAEDREPGFAAALARAVIDPLKSLAKRPLWAEILAFIVLFKFGDAMLGRMSGVFFREMGFDYVTIAEVSKLYGIGAAFAGGLVAGGALRVLGAGRGLFLAGIVMSATNLLFSALAAAPDRAHFILAVAGDGFTSGFATVAFVAFLSRLCEAGYAATQYALLASIANFARIQLAGSSGWIVDRLNGDWSTFFALTAAMALPGLALLAHVLSKTRMGDAAFSPTHRTHR